MARLKTSHSPLWKELAAQKLRTGPHGPGLLLGMTAEHPFDPSTVRRRARAAWKKSSLSPTRLHEARDTAASFMIATGLNIKETSTYMAHASVTITLDRTGTSSRAAATRPSRRWTPTSAASSGPPHLTHPCKRPSVSVI